MQKYIKEMISMRCTRCNQDIPDYSKPFEKKTMYNNMVDIIFCNEEDTAKELMQFYIDKGYSVSKSNVLIKCGTRGFIPQWRLDIYKKEDGGSRKNGLLYNIEDGVIKWE
jgi:hypothetical protein